MPTYFANYEHPNEEGWQQHVAAHIVWLQDRSKDGSLLASGPFEGTPVRGALLVFAADNKTAVNKIIASDPFAIEGLIENLRVTEWDPIFGAWNDRSSLPGRSLEPPVCASFW